MLPPTECTIKKTTPAKVFVCTAWLFFAVSTHAGVRADDGQAPAAAMARSAKANGWLSFMGDGAHAIHRAAQNVRRDGLLESASRYPRTSSAGWTPQQDRQGHYEYIERIIDCETGLYVNTSLKLLDEHSKPIARQAFDYQDQLQRIALRQRDVARHRWPSTSEIWLACVAAANPELDAAAVRELAALTRDGNGFAYDVQALGRAPPHNGHALFERLRDQYAAWRKRYTPDPALGPASPDETKGPQPTPRKGERWLTVQEGYAERRMDLSSLSYLGNGVIEIVEDVRDRSVVAPPPGLPDNLDRRVNLAIDCRTGLTVPVEQLLFTKSGDDETDGGEDSGGELLQRGSTHVLRTMHELARSLTRGSGWTQWLGPSGTASVAAMICHRAAMRCAGGEPLGLFEIDPTALPPQGGAALVNAAHDIWFDHRASFVPSCAAGATR